MVIILILVIESALEYEELRVGRQCALLIVTRGAIR